MIRQGRGSRLFDERGQSYLDTRNNVCHIGHAHPAVAEVVAAQLSVLNTNTRYLHPTMVQLAKELLETFPPPLSKVFFVNSGSEANDLALRLARAYSGGSTNTITVQGAYHGHTLGVLEISPYKYLAGTEYRDTYNPLTADRQTPGPHIWQVPAPDTFRGKHRDAETAGEEYAKYVQKACHHYTQRGERVRAFVMEGGLSTGGVILPPKGYIRQCAEAVRAAGGLYIADEVQTGFGRFGSTFWAFQHEHNQGVVPDIVTLGKPMGNGMPLAAVVTTEEVTRAFESKGVEYFNTFGGNPVCAAAGLAVLKVIKDEKLAEHAFKVGGYMKEKFSSLLGSTSFPLSGEIRGCGLFLGIELIRSKDKSDPMKPATAETSFICSQLRTHYQILTSIDGIYDNVLVIKPPMVFNKADVDYFVSSFEKVVLRELPPLDELMGREKTPT